MTGLDDRSIPPRKTMADATFPKQFRLLLSTQYRRVFQRKLSVADNVLVVYGCENNLPHMRLGLVVSRRVGSAVVRNRWKRLIREAFRVHIRSIPAGVDIVVLPRRGAEGPSWELEDVQHSLQTLVARLLGRLRRDGEL